jgi:DNA-binding response OmpR family regulator
MERAFHFAGVANPLVTVPNGQLAVEYLASLHEQDPALIPCLVLLDLNLPLKSGLEVLKWIRAHPLFCTLPVLVISSSDQDSDIHRAYVHGVNGYLVKPSNPKELQAMVKALKDYWLTYNHCTETASNLVWSVRHTA